jgi:hypothetical protein
MKFKPRPPRVLIASQGVGAWAHSRSDPICLGVARPGGPAQVEHRTVISRITKGHCVSISLLPSSASPYARFVSASIAVIERPLSDLIADIRAGELEWPLWVQAVQKREVVGLGFRLWFLKT